MSTSFQSLASECLERYAGCLWGESFVEALPTPRLGISAPQAVSKISGCGGGAPYPIGGVDRSGTARVCMCMELGSVARTVGKRLGRRDEGFDAFQSTWSTFVTQRGL